MAREPMSDVIVLLPGILGSVLQKDGKDVWGLSKGAIFRGLFSRGGSIKDLKLEGDDPDVDDLGDGVSADRLMSDVHFVPGFWKVDGYEKIADTIKKRFDVREGENFFEFPYDWRRHNIVAARKLARQSHDWLKSWRADSGNADAKLILVGHSMGGIVSRAYLELLEGWKNTRMLITFGTPYRGSLNALSFLASGFKKGIGPVTLLDLSDLLRSLSSVYELLPIYECYDPGNEQLVRVGETTGIPNVEADRARAALNFHTEIWDAVRKNRGEPEYVEHGYETYPIVGIDQPTLQCARLEGDRVRMLRTIQGDDMGGDGTVPRVSAMPREMTSPRQAMFSSESHSSLQNHDGVLTQLLGLLTGGFDPTKFMALPTGLGLDVEDMYETEIPILIRGRATDPEQELSVTVVDADSDTEVASTTFPAGDDWRTAELPPLRDGVYRAVLSTPSTADTVTDLFIAYSPEN